MSDKKHIPNSFQMPNHYVDEVLELLTPEEFCCLTFAVRHIYGWRDKITKKRGRISMSAFVNGYRTKDGKCYRGTGLNYTTVNRALDGLTEYRLLIRVGNITQDGQEWEIGADVDLEGLRQRHEHKLTKQHAKAARARAGKAAGALSDRAPQSSMAQSTSVLYGIEHQSSMAQSTSPLSHRGNQTYSQTHTQTQLNNAPVGALPSSPPSSEESPLPGNLVTEWVSAASETDLVYLPDDWDGRDEFSPRELYPCTPADVNALIAMWWEWVPKRPIRRGKVVDAKEHFANSANREFAETLVQHGVVPADVARFLGDVRFNPDSAWKHLREKAMTFCYMGEVLQDWVRLDREENWYTYDCPRITPRRPDKTIDMGVVEEGDNLLERLREHPDLIVDVPPDYISPHEVAGADEPTEDSTFSASDEELLAELNTMGITI